MLPATAYRNGLAKGCAARQGRDEAARGLDLRPHKQARSDRARVASHAPLQGASRTQRARAHASGCPARRLTGEPRFFRLIWTLEGPFEVGRSI
eukprot:scaffold4454_cov411-Prasinococcus_capsulatus_cf.AAC.3